MSARAVGNMSCDSAIRVSPLFVLFVSPIRYEIFQTRNDNFRSDRLLTGGVVTWEY